IVSIQILPSCKKNEKEGLLFKHEPDCYNPQDKNGENIQQSAQNQEDKVDQNIFADPNQIVPTVGSQINIMNTNADIIQDIENQKVPSIQVESSCNKEEKEGLLQKNNGDQQKTQIEMQYIQEEKQQMDAQKQENTNKIGQVLSGKNSKVIQSSTKNLDLNTQVFSEEEDDNEGQKEEESCMLGQDKQKAQEQNWIEKKINQSKNLILKYLDRLKEEYRIFKKKKKLNVKKKLRIGILFSLLFVVLYLLIAYYYRYGFVRGSLTLGNNEKVVIKLESCSLMIYDYSLRHQYTLDVNFLSAGHTIPQSVASDQNIYLRYTYPRAIHYDSIFKQSNDNGVKTLYFKNEFDSYECEIVMFIYKETQLQSLDINCGDTKQCNLIVYSNQLSITTMNVKGLNVQMNAPYLKADYFTYLSMKGSIEVPFFVFKTADINTREGDISVQSTSDISLTYNQTEPYNCLSSKQIANSANTFLNLQDYQNSIQFQTDLTKCEAIYPWGLDKSAQSPDKVIEYRCYSNKVILKNTGQMQSTLNASNSYGNIYVNVISGQGQYSQTFSSDNIILFNKAGKNDNQDNNKNIDYINFSNLSQSNLQNQTKSAQNPNIYDPIFVYQIGPKFTRSATFQQVQFSYNPAYSYIKPYWLGWLTLTLMTTQKYTGQYTISPGFCPYVPALSLERIRSTQQMITNFMQQNQAPQHGLATNAWQPDVEYPPQQFVQKEIYNGFKDISLNRNSDELWIGIDSDQSKNYTITNYHISKNYYLSSAIYVSCILSGIVGIILVIILAFAINKNYTWILNHMASLRKYSSLQKEKKIEEEKLQENFDKTPENESQIFAPSFSLRSIPILFRKVICSSPPLIAFIDYIVHLLYKAKVNSIEKFYEKLFRKEKKSQQDEEDIHNLEKYQILGNEMKQLYEKFCYLNQYLERKLDDEQNLKYLTAKGFKIVSKIGAQTQYFTYIKYNQKIATISEQPNKTSLDLFISSCCSITNFETDRIEFSELESYYQEFCNLNHMQEIQLNEGSLKRDYGISTVYMPQQWIERYDISKKKDIYVIDKQKVEDHFKIFLDENKFQQNDYLNTEEHKKVQKQQSCDKYDFIIVFLHAIGMILIGCPLIFLVIFIRVQQSSYSLIPPMRLIFFDTVLNYPASIPAKLKDESHFVVVIIWVTLLFYGMCIYDMIIYYAKIDFPQEKYFTKYKKFNCFIKLPTQMMWCIVFISFYTFAVYFSMVAIWLMLGAIINPNAFLPYATSAATFVTLVTKKYKDFREISQNGFKIIYDYLQQMTISQFQDLFKKIDIQDRIADMVPTDTIKEITVEASKLGIIDASTSEDIQNNLEIMIKDPASVSKLGQEIIKISQDPVAYTQNISLKLEERAKAMIQQQISFVDKQLRDELFNLIWCLIKNQKTELKNSIRLFVDALINLFQNKQGKQLLKSIGFINLNGPVFDFVWEFAFPQENFKGNYQDHLTNVFCVALANMISVWNKQLKPIISGDYKFQNQKNHTDEQGDNTNNKKQITEQQQLKEKLLKDIENADQLIKVGTGQEEEQEIELTSEEAITYAYKNIIYSVIQICRSIQSSNNEVILNQILNLVQNGSKLPGFDKLNQIKQYQDIFKIGYAIFKNNGEVDFEDVDSAIKGFLKNTGLEDQVKEKTGVGILDVFKIVEIIIESIKGQSKLMPTNAIKKALEKLLDSYKLASITKTNADSKINLDEVKQGEECLKMKDEQKIKLNEINSAINELEQQKIKANKIQTQNEEKQEKIFQNLKFYYNKLLKKNQDEQEQQQDKEENDKIIEEIKICQDQKCKLEQCIKKIKDKEQKLYSQKNELYKLQEDLQIIPSERDIKDFKKTKFYKTKHKQLEYSQNEEDNEPLIQQQDEQLSIADQIEEQQKLGEINYIKQNIRQLDPDTKKMLEKIAENMKITNQLENEIKNINDQYTKDLHEPNTQFDTQLEKQQNQLNECDKQQEKILTEISKIMTEIQKNEEEIKQIDMDMNQLDQIKKQMDDFEAYQKIWSKTCQNIIQYHQKIDELNAKKEQFDKNIEEIENKYKTLIEQKKEKNIQGEKEEEKKTQKIQENVKYQSTGLTIMINFFSGSISNLQADLIKELGSFFELVSEEKSVEDKVKNMFKFLKNQILDNSDDQKGKSNNKGKKKINNFQSILNLLDIFLHDSIIASDKIVKKGKDYFLEDEVVKSLQILFTSRFEGFIKQKDIDNYFKGSDLLELISKFLKMKEDTILGFMEMLLGYKTSRDAHTFMNFATSLNKIKENKINILMHLYNLYSSKNPSELYDALNFFQVTNDLPNDYKSITVKDLVSVLLFMRDSLKYRHVQKIFEKIKIDVGNEQNNKDSKAQPTTQDINEKPDGNNKQNNKDTKAQPTIQDIKEQLKQDTKLPDRIKKLLEIEIKGDLFANTIKTDFNTINQNKQVNVLEQADFNFFKKFSSIRNIPRIQDPTQNSLVKQSISDIADMLNLDYQSIQLFINLLTSSKSENIKQSLDTLQILNINPKCDDDDINKFVEYSSSVLEKIETKDQIIANISKNLFSDQLPVCLLRKILYHQGAIIKYSDYLDLFNIYCNNNIPKSITNLIDFRFGITGNKEEDIYKLLHPSLLEKDNDSSIKKEEKIYIQGHEGLLKAVQILSINDEAVRIQHFLQFLIETKQEALLTASCLLVYFSGRSSNITLEKKINNKTQCNIEEMLCHQLDLKPEFFEAIHTYFQQDTNYCIKTMIKFYRQIDYLEQKADQERDKNTVLKNKLTISEKNVEQYVRLVNHMQFNTSYVSKDTNIPIEAVELVSNLMYIKYSKSQQERNVIFDSMRSNIYISKLFQQLGVNHQELVTLIKLMYQDYEPSNIKWIQKSLKLPLQFKIDGLQQLAMIDQVLPIYGDCSQNKKQLVNLIKTNKFIKSFKLDTTWAEIAYILCKGDFCLLSKYQDVLIPLKYPSSLSIEKCLNKQEKKDTEASIKVTQAVGANEREYNSLVQGLVGLLSCRYSSFQTTEFLYQLYTIINEKYVKNQHIAIEEGLKKGNTLQYAIYKFTKSTQISPIWTLLMMGDQNTWEYIAQSYYLVNNSKKPYLNPILALVYVLNFRSKPMIIKQLLVDLEYAQRCCQIYIAQSQTKEEEQNKQAEKIKKLKKEINEILEKSLEKNGEKLLQIAEEFNFPKKVIKMLMLYEQDQQEKKKQKQNTKDHEEEKKDIKFTTTLIQNAFEPLEKDMEREQNKNKFGEFKELEMLNKVFEQVGTDFYTDPRREKMNLDHEEKNFTKNYCLYTHSSSPIMQMVVLSTISQLKLSYFDFYGYNEHDEDHKKQVTFAIDLILGTLEKYYYFDDMMDFFPRHRLIPLIGLSVGFIIEQNDVINCKTSRNIFGKDYYENVILKVCERVFQDQEKEKKDNKIQNKEIIDKLKYDLKLEYLRLKVDGNLNHLQDSKSKYGQIFKRICISSVKSELENKDIQKLVDNYDQMMWDSFEKEEILYHITNSKCYSSLNKVSSYVGRDSQDEIDHYSGEKKKDLFEYLDNLSKVSETENFQYLIDLYKENYISLNENDYFKANYGQDSNMYFGTLMLNGIIQQQIKQIKMESFQSYINQASLYMVSNKKVLAEILSLLIPSLESNFTSLNEQFNITEKNLQSFINLAMGKSKYQSKDLEGLLKKSSLLDSNKETLKNCVSAYQGDMRQYFKLIDQSEYFKQSPAAVDLFTKFLWSFEKNSMHNTTNNPYEINYFEFCNLSPNRHKALKIAQQYLWKLSQNISYQKWLRDENYNEARKKKYNFDYYKKEKMYNKIADEGEDQYMSLLLQKILYNDWNFLINKEKEQLQDAFNIIFNTKSDDKIMEKLQILALVKPLKSGLKVSADNLDNLIKFTNINKMINNGEQDLFSDKPDSKYLHLLLSLSNNSIVHVLNILNTFKEDFKQVQVKQEEKKQEQKCSEYFCENLPYILQSLFLWKNISNIKSDQSKQLKDQKDHFIQYLSILPAAILDNSIMKKQSTKDQQTTKNNENQNKMLLPIILNKMTVKSLDTHIFTKRSSYQSNSIYLIYQKYNEVVSSEIPREFEEQLKKNELQNVYFLLSFLNGSFLNEIGKHHKLIEFLAKIYFKGFEAIQTEDTKSITDYLDQCMQDKDSFIQIILKENKNFADIFNQALKIILTLQFSTIKKPKIDRDKRVYILHQIENLLEKVGNDLLKIDDSVKDLIQVVFYLITNQETQKIKDKAELKDKQYCLIELLKIAFENPDLYDFFFQSHKAKKNTDQPDNMINAITDILQSILDKPTQSIKDSDLVKEVLKLLKYASKGNIDVSIIEQVISIINGDHQSIFSLLKKFEVVEENKIVLIQRVYNQIVDMPIFKKIDKAIVGTSSNEERNTFQEIMNKLKDGKATINDLFVALDAQGDNNGSISIDEFQSLFSRLGMELSRNRVYEIFAYVKNKKQKSIGAIKTDDLSLDVEEFEKAFKYVNDKKTSMSLEKLGISPALLALALGVLVVILIALFIFIFLGIKAFTVGGTFGSIINSLIPMTAALGVTGTQENKKDKLKEEEISNAIDKTLTIIHSENI
ncbi:hypothetical protein ABPG73_017261, partial [Tetrahymena malaccensis]